MKFVMDSSALVPILHDEDETDNAHRFFDLCRKIGISLSISPLARCEVGNCILQFAKREHKDPMVYLNRFLRIDLEMIPMDDDLLLEAMDIAKESKLTFYDAIHAAGAKIAGSPLVTLDEALLARTKNALDLADAIDYLESLSNEFQ
jgi:predicted nucleic acid-binding protein